jgi:predicted ATPase/class 3 adenylate cyclase
MGRDALGAPVGTVTFLLTDVEGSTQAWESFPERMESAIARHYELIHEVVAAHDGYLPIEQGEGDSVVAAFERPSAAVAAALDAQRQLENELADVFRVRMALHTGEALRRGEFYVGESLNRTARLRGCGHGGQILLSRATADLLAGRLTEGVSLVSLGTHRLRGFNRPEEVWQVQGPGAAAAFPPLVSIEVERGSLPLPRHPLIGRDGEVAALASALKSHRLVTLTGVGGVGKTRLALAVADEVRTEFPDGVWWVELAPVERDGRVGEAVLRAVGMFESPALTPLRQVTTALEGWQALLALDNCEHVIEDAAIVVDALLRGCPTVSVLTTSREPLNVTGESVWPIDGLPVAEQGSPARRLLDTASVQFFADRAARARPGFAVHDANVEAVSEVCRRLDGIPLALELASSHVRTMPLTDIVEALDDRFALLMGGARTELPRHQTMLASLSWSHELLRDAERRVFRRLWVFAGGFTADAADAVAGIDLDARACRSALLHLVDTSLVQLDHDAGRYRMLETMRQFAADRADDASEAQEVRRRHLAWVVDFLQSLDIAMLEDPTLAAIEGEYENVRAALEFAITDGDGAAVTIVHSLAQFWSIAGRLVDATTFAHPVLRELHDREPRQWAAIVAKLGVAMSSAGDPDFIPRTVAEAQAIAVAAGDHSTVGHCLQGQLSTEFAGSSAWDEAYELAVRGGDRRLTVILAAICPGPSVGTERGEALLDRARRLASTVDISGSRYIPDGFAATHAALRGDLAGARRLGRRCLDEPIRSPLMHLRFAIAFTSIARLGGDQPLLDLIADRIPMQWRDLPAQRQLFQYLEHALAPQESPIPDCVDQSWLGVQPFSVLVAADVFFRLLLDASRDAELARWVAEIPTTWPAAHLAGQLALAWTAFRGAEPGALSRAGLVLENSRDLGVALYQVEALDLVAAHLAATDPSTAARLLTSSDAGRRAMGLRTRYRYHQRAVTAARKAVRAGLPASRPDEHATKPMRLLTATNVALDACGEEATTVWRQL